MKVAASRIILFLLFPFVLGGQEAGREVLPVVQGSLFSGHGERTGSSIRITVGGSVKHRGVYHVSKNDSLQDILLRVGDMWTPGWKAETVSIYSPEDPSTRLREFISRYPLYRSGNSDHLQDVYLQDEMKIYISGYFNNRA